MPKISVIIPHAPLSPYLDSLLDRCTKSLSGYDEFVLVLNDAIGYGKAFNQGLKYAKGDYLVCVSNDTVLTGGSLADLCKPGVVTYSRNAQWGCFFCLPRSVYEQIGGFDERFEKAYWEDVDYRKRLEVAGISCLRIDSIEVQHEGGATVKTLGIEGEAEAFGRRKYIEKYGHLDNNVG